MPNTVPHYTVAPGPESEHYRWGKEMKSEQERADVENRIDKGLFGLCLLIAIALDTVCLMLAIRLSFTTAIFAILFAVAFAMHAALRRIRPPYEEAGAAWRQIYKRGYPCNANAPYRLCFLSTICR